MSEVSVFSVLNIRERGSHRNVYDGRAIWYDHDNGEAIYEYISKRWGYNFDLVNGRLGRGTREVPLGCYIIWHKDRVRWISRAEFLRVYEVEPVVKLATHPDYCVGDDA